MIFIEQVQLENIKSYKEARVQFQEGVNFICGVNGAGKTTIVEAIGYALFDAAPAKPIKGFIKHGAQRGTVRVTFVGADNNRYVSERIVFGKGGGHWRIYDAERGDALDMNNQEEILQFFQEGAMPIRGGKLDDLFQTMIGVPQGMICAPFLETPAKRKQAFDSILQVDGYKKAYQKTSGVESHFKNRRTELSERREIFERQAEGYDAAKEQIQELETAQAELKKKEANEKAKRKEAQADQLRMEQREREINDARNKQTEAAGEVEVKKANARNLAGELEKAAEAERVCAKNADDHAAHTDARKRIDALVQQQHERDALLKNLNEKEQERASLKTRIQTVQESVDQNETQLKEKLERVKKEIEAEAPGKQKIESAVADASERRRYWEEAFKKSDALTERLPSLNALLQVGKRAAESIQRSIEQREELTASLNEYEAVKALSETFDAAEEKRNALRDHLNQLEAQAEEAERRQKEAKDGLCPILREPCQNVGGGDLSLRIVSDLEQMRAKMREPQTALAAAEEEMKKARDAKEELSRLEKIRDQVGSHETAEKERRDEVETARAEIEWESWKREAESLETELGEAAPEAAGLQRFVRHLASAENASTDNLEMWTAQTEEALKKIDNSINDVNESVERHVQQAESAQNDGKLELQRRVDKITNLEKEKSGIEADMEKAKQTRAQLKTDVENLTEMQSEIEALNENLKAYERVDERMQEARKTANATSGGYQLYLQHETAAKGISAVRSQLEKAHRSQQAAEGALAGAEKELADLQRGFDPEKLTALRERIETLNAAVTEISAKISAGDENLKNARAELEKMEEALREIEKIDKEIDRNERAEKLAAFVRSRMLNVVGERISYLYRRRVAEQGSDLYRQLSGDPQALLDWSDDYELNLTGGPSPRSFKQLSGGEQMSAALSVRLALLALLSEIGIAVFDEPTANLDDMRRERLAAALSTLRQQPGVQWRQLFIISHDDTFDNAVDTAVRIEKDPIKGSGLAAEQ